MTSRRELLNDWPANSEDAAGAERLVGRGLPALEPVLPDVIHWLKSNGSVRDVFGRFIADNGAVAIEPVRIALQGTHEEQIHYLLTRVLPRWQAPELIGLQHELEQWLQRPSLSGLNVFALVLLHQSGAAPHSPVAEWAALFRERLDAQGRALDALGLGAP